jgi:SAM-dependent methyltransferase
MAASDKLFAGSIPEIYDSLLVPLLFEGYARDLAERVARLEARNILETAAGTGVLTRALGSRLPAAARIVATDLNQPMLDRAAKRQREDRRISWRQAYALELPFAHAEFDVVACQFGVMFFPDKARGYKEARRVLEPGGRFLFSVWDRISENEIAEVVTEAVAAVFPKDPPAFLPRAPYGYYEVRMIREDLIAARFGSVSVDSLDATGKAGSAREAAIAFCQGTPLRNEIEARDASRPEEATTAAAAALARRFGNGAIEGRMRAHVITAGRS